MDTIPVLSAGAHREEEGFRCAMEHLAWTLGVEHSDNPATAWIYAAHFVQDTNDELATLVGEVQEVEVDYNGFKQTAHVKVLPPEIAVRLIDLAWLTVDTREAVEREGDAGAAGARVTAARRRHQHERSFEDFRKKLHDEVYPLTADVEVDAALRMKWAHEYLDEATALLAALRADYGMPERPQSVYPMQSVVTIDETAAV